MTRGLRYLPAPRSGRRRLGVLGLGLLAAMSLVWQQQATMASYFDTEHTRATFTAASLSAITPEFTTTAATVKGNWAAASGSWATPNYVLAGATTSTGGNATQVYSGSARTFTQEVGGDPTSGVLPLTAISAGGTHACGIARGELYCWGTSTTGALGLGATTVTNTPTKVAGALAGKIVTDVSTGTDHTCAIADGAAYCWGSPANGRLGNSQTSGTYTAPVAVAVSGVLSGRTVTGISAGGAHSCAVADGLAFCWGLNTNGRLGNSSTTQSATAVAVTTASGLLQGRTVTDISAGGAHSCAVADGLAFCWGVNTSGRLGNNSTSQSTSPVAVTATGALSDRSVTAISAGDQHTCAVADALAFCWGSTTNGRLGNGVITAGTQSTPVAVNGTVATLGKVTAISAGFTHSCAIADGSAHCWGAGGSGQIGNGATTASVSAAVAVSAGAPLSGRTLTTISAGNQFSCTNGNTPGSCWGLGTSGQVGNGASSTRTTPADISLTGPSCTEGSVLIGDTACSLLQGTDYYGRLGYSIGTWTAPNSAWVKATTKSRGAVSPESTAKTTTSITLGWPQVSELLDSYADYTLQRSTASSGSNPVTVYQGAKRAALDRGGFAKRTSSLDVGQISAGLDHSCAILEGAAYCWGDNTDGELGTNTTTSVSVPTAVVSTGALAGKTVTALSAGENHTCAVADGGVSCWGYNLDGRVGGTSTSDKLVPTAVGSFTTATDVSSGYWHSCALADGKVYCWGDNTRGQLGDGSTTNRTSPVLVQGLLAGKTVTAITAGGAHTCAIAEAKAYCWGSNVSGQLGINSSGATTNSPMPVALVVSGAFTNTNVTAVSAGYAHSCAIAGGKAYCWGHNGSGQIGNNTNANALVATAVTNLPWATNATLASVSAGGYSSCVLAAGKAYCWGEGASGRLGSGSTADQRTPVAVVSTGVMIGTLAQVVAGEEHGCAVSSAIAYCWGNNGSGRLGDSSTTNRTAPVAVQLVAGPACSSGAALITPATCSLTPGTTYYYRMKFVVDGGLTATSGWVGVKTQS